MPKNYIIFTITNVIKSHIRTSLYAVFLTTFALLSTLATPVLALSKPLDVPAQAATNQAHLADAKLRSCQAKEDAIKKRASRLTQLATTMEGNFDKHAQRVEDYYTSKVVPSGKTVANYDSLVADIQAKKSAVASALTTAQNDATNFSCTGADPKSQLTQFRKDMQAVKRALKDYRTSIKNLIVAVRSVTGTTESESKSSPKP